MYYNYFTGLYILPFLRATAGTAIERLSHRNSVCPSVRPSVTRLDQAKTVQARIIIVVHSWRFLQCKLTYIYY